MENSDSAGLRPYAVAALAGGSLYLLLRSLTPSHFHIGYSAFIALGILAGALSSTYILVRQRALVWQSTAGIALSALGFLYGRHVNYRLAHFPLGEALQVPAESLAAGGGHSPLGAVVAVATAVAVTAAFRGPWRSTMDAAAVGWVAALGTGRFGCLFAGCCSGTDCHSWPERLCIRYPRGSEPFVRQFQEGAISIDSAFSAPVHPLPVYLALSMYALLGLLLWRLARGAPAGQIGLIFFLIYPCIRLLIDPMRAAWPQPVADVTQALLLQVLVLDLAVIALIAVRRWVYSPTRSAR